MLVIYGEPQNRRRPYEHHFPVTRFYQELRDNLGSVRYLAVICLAVKSFLVPTQSFVGFSVSLLNDS